MVFNTISCVNLFHLNVEKSLFQYNQIRKLATKGTIAITRYIRLVTSEVITYRPFYQVIITRLILQGMDYTKLSFTLLCSL